MYRKITLTCLALAWLLPARAADHSLADLSFMLGHWQGDPGEGGFEEIWLPEAEGVMTGFFRWPSVRGHYVLELTTITSIDAEIVLRFKHFNPDITTWEEGQALAYTLTSLAGECVLFSGTDLPDNVPALMEYCRLDPDTLRFRGAGKGQSIQDADFILLFHQR